MSPTQLSASNAEAPSKRRHPWISVLALGCVALLIWALLLQPMSTARSTTSRRCRPRSTNGRSLDDALVTGIKDAYDLFAHQLGSTKDDLAVTKQDISDAEQAEQAATAAAQDATAAANDAVERAQARAQQAQVQAEGAAAKTRVVADCAKAYVSAFDTLLESESGRAGASAVARGPRRLLGRLPGRPRRCLACRTPFDRSAENARCPPSGCGPPPPWHSILGPSRWTPSSPSERK